MGVGRSRAPHSWANKAGRAFWGAASNDGLRDRKFHARNKAVLRMAALASDAGESASGSRR